MFCHATLRASPLVCLLVMSLSACSGSIGDAAGPAGAGSAPRASGSAGSGSSAAAGAPAQAGATTAIAGPGVGPAGKYEPPPGSPPTCTAPTVGATLFRRLTRREYDNTVRDLLGASGSPSRSFPPEEKAAGFANNPSVLSVSPLLAEQYLGTADLLAASATAPANLRALLPCDPSTGEDACAQKFVQVFGRRAFRRPLTAAEVQRYGKLYGVGRQSDFAAGIKVVIAAMLQSPHFLYRVEFGAPAKPGDRFVRLSPWETAARLSYLLWSTMPDDALATAADQGKLVTRDEIAVQVKRMLADARTKAQVAAFHDEWLTIDDYGDVEKDPKVFRAFTSDLVPFMRQETQHLVSDLFWNGSLGGLFTATHSFVNLPLAKYYGVTGPKGSAFERVDMDPTQRAGVLTQGGLLGLLAGTDQTSPVRRGLFVRERLLCTPPPPPPPGINVKPPELSATLTTRERFTQHAADPTCGGCHRLMDPIGLGLENYDGAGRWRASENGKPIDAAGELANTEGGGPFAGAPGLGQKLATSRAAADCVATQWFRYGYGRSEAPEDQCSVASLKKRLADAGNKLPELLVALTETDAFLYRALPGAGGTP